MDFLGKVATPKHLRTKAVLSPLFLRFRTDNERTTNGEVVKENGKSGLL